MTFEEIMEQIKKGLTSDKERDFSYLREQIKKYEHSEYSKAISRECSKMMYEMLPKEALEIFESTMRKNLEAVYGELQKADQLLKAKEYEKALEITAELVKKADDLPMFRDDTQTAYYSFWELFEEILYKQIYKPTKEIKRADYPFSTIYYLHGCALHGLERYEEEEKYLEAARKWNPINSKIVLQYTENLKERGKLEELFVITKDLLMYTFHKDDLARCYRNLGYYFFENEKYKEAVAAYILSLKYDNDSEDAISDLYHIRTEAGIAAEDLKDEDILAIAKEYVFIPGVSKEVLQMAYGIGNRSLENGQKVAAKYFLGIANQYLQDTEIEKKISEL